PPVGPAAILVIRPRWQPRADIDTLLSPLHRALDWLEHHSTTAFGLVRADHATILASTSAREGLTSLAGPLVTPADSPPQSPITAGVSAPLEQLDDAPHALDQALQAACVSGAIEQFAPVAHWSELGIYAMLPTEADPAWKASELDIRYRRLRRADPSGIL